MGYVLAVLYGGAAALGLALLLLASWSIYYDFMRTKIPPGLRQPFKLHLLHVGIVMIFTLGKALEILRLCRQVVFIRFLITLKKSKTHPGVSAKDFVFDEIPVRVYYPKTSWAGRRKGFVFYHGGAGMIGSIRYYQDITSKIAKESEAVVVVVGYRLSPEHPFPTQWQDCLAATVHFMKHAEEHGVDPSQIAIGGDSAGGNFATVISQVLLGCPDLPKLRAQVLIYPGLQALDFNLPSYQQNAVVPILFRDSVVYYGLKYFLKDPSLVDDILKGSHVPDAFRQKCEKWLSLDNIPEKFKCRKYERRPLGPFKPEIHNQVPFLLQTTFSSLFVEDAILRQFPETFIVSCEYDVLRDDSLLYKKRLEENGVKVTWFHAEQGFHGIINLCNMNLVQFPAGVEILEKVADFVHSL
ncbi:arylacetamide deacetylase-like 3 [Protobothrops mucrosquamatus]|uniref:arylacetamide deacetylase-like 3 n=1 Tax=Protobothrops mucrosquamatus TaxID=103944 RepID=UPI000775792A|nr:arylacetamide deacetylase-like 3 [Protobothrops mucrosquamatus]